MESSRFVTSSNPPQCTVAANTEWPWEIELKRRVDAAAAKSELASRKQAGVREVFTFAGGAGASAGDVQARVFVQIGDRDAQAWSRRGS